MALQAGKDRVSLEDGESLYQWVSSLCIAFVHEEEKTRVLCNGEDVTEAIRSPEISLLASDISKKKSVREALVEKQREMGREGGVVLEGRDVGTVVFPGAHVKFYLDADPEERARRRYDELVEKRLQVDFQRVRDEVVRRDENDMHRTHSPLRTAEDAVRIDSTHRSAEEIVEEMYRLVRKKMEVF